MAAVVSLDNATPDGSGARYLTEASDLGLPAGEWPPQLQTVLGNGRPFEREWSLTAPDGEFGGFHYAQDGSGVVLYVVND